ncbi:sugar ABC transporter substrate-binding protein [Thermus scotoductus]|uniref:LacI family transcriptional regulator n=2 Tax=Thermus scotoductus TaxID=37636 RepID=A0A430R568_THESC|nr:sugar ABC transporter substrate-binding protein [Thermus scotoductus]RTH02582.1 LacI family transcriptional regulator [Thermus scotoductus]RTH25713.1 LacI family transcriptional regulator [Thermus scotoductus]RTI39791.1 LacI family transcriptional regulator [Thermus scotoductus]
MRWLRTGLSVLALFGFGLALGQQLRFIVVTHGQAADPFWSVVKNGVDQAAREMGVRVEYRAPQTFDMVQMARLIDAAVAARPDGLVVSIPDANALGRSIQAAVRAGIPVISINSGADVFKRLGVMVHVGQEEYLAGKGAGERMKALGVKAAVCVNHEVGNVGLDQRCKGFADGLGGKVEILAVKTDFTEARNAIANYLQRNPNLEGILTLGPVGAEPALQALQQVGRLGRIRFATFDLSTAVLEALEKKQMDFAVDQQQYLQGYLPIVLLTLYKRYGLLPANDIILTGPGFVTPENARRVIDLTKKGIR